MSNGQSRVSVSFEVLVSTKKKIKMSFSVLHFLWLSLFSVGSNGLLVGEMTKQKVLVERSQRVTEVAMARCGRLNEIDLPMLDELRNAFVDEDHSDTFLLTSLDSRAFCTGSSSLTNTSFLAASYSLFEVISSKSCLALADGRADGFGAALFLASRQRVVTQSATLSMPVGPLCPPLYFLRGGQEWIGLTGPRLNAHDCVRLGFATGFVRRNDQPAFLDHLKDGHLETSRAVSKDMATPLSTDCVERVLERVSADSDSAEEMIAVVERERKKARDLIGSCAWQTREQAELVLDVLDAGAEALKNSSPLSLETSMRALRTDNLDIRSPFDAHIVELVINTNLCSLAEVASVDERSGAEAVVSAAAAALQRYGTSTSFPPHTNLQSRLERIEKLRRDLEERKEFLVL